MLRTRRGIPITLALLYIELAQTSACTRAASRFPGHFLVKLHMPQGEVVIDPFTGQSLSREELDELLVPYSAAAGLVGEFEVPLGLFLQAAPPRDMIAAHAAQPEGDPPQRRRTGRAARGAGAPGDPAAGRLGRAARPRPGPCGAGRLGAAVIDLEAYLAHAPDALDDAIADRVAELRRARN